MKPSEIPGLFDFVEPEPLPTIGESRAEFEREARGNWKRKGCGLT